VRSNYKHRGNTEDAEKIGVKNARETAGVGHIDPMIPMTPIIPILFGK